MKRKTFLTAVSMLASGAVVGRSLLHEEKSGPERVLPIVDTHQHLVDFNRFGEDWASPPVAGNFGIEEYKKAAEGLHIVKAVYMEVGVQAAKRYEEARYATELCMDPLSPTAGAVIAADLYDENFRGYLSTFKNNSCIKGIRAGFRSADSLLDSRIVDNIRFLGDMGLRFDFIVPPAWFPQMAELIHRCPDTQFQADHCGNADPKIFFDLDVPAKPDQSREEWLVGITGIAAQKNVVCKISGLVSRLAGYAVTTENLAPPINHCLDIFGPDRVMFASDWPWSLKGTTLSSWVQLLKEVVSDRPFKDQKKLFHDNAIRHYKI